MPFSGLEGRLVWKMRPFRCHRPRECGVECPLRPLGMDDDFRFLPQAISRRTHLTCLSIIHLPASAQACKVPTSPGHLARKPHPSVPGPPPAYLSEIHLPRSPRPDRPPGPLAVPDTAIWPHMPPSTSPQCPESHPHVAGDFAIRCMSRCTLPFVQVFGPFLGRMRGSRRARSFLPRDTLHA